MKILVLCPGYPSKENLYNNGFIHSRVKNYLANHLDVEVFSVNKRAKYRKYKFEKVLVNEGNYKDLEKFLENNKYDKILIHFAWAKILKTVIKKSKTTKLIIWVHGVEALGWYRRLFLFNIKKFYRFIGYIIVNTKQLFFMHNFIRNKKIDKEFVFVSEWMKDIFENDSFSKEKIINYHIIPNVIDNNVFKYIEKGQEQRLNILTIRPFASKKYANDLTVKAILELQKEPFFNKLSFNIYGDGKLFKSVTKPLEKLKNVKLHKRFLSQSEIAEIHKNNGIMLIPTRQDAQGVSMCEAMMSGLVPITSNNTAIPEFVNKQCGYLANDYHELAQAIKELYNDPEVFLEKSRNAHTQMMKICSPKVVIQNELDIIKR